MPSQLILPLEHRAAMTRTDFIVAPGNAKALAFLEAWPDWPVPAASLFGPPASGKTHLAHIWAAQTGAAWISASDLKEVVDGPLVIENAEERFGDENALFAMLEKGTPLLLTGRIAPALWPVSLPDLVSRLRALLAFELGAPDEALLLALAVKLFADRQVTVPESVVLHLVRQLERSPAALRDFIVRADSAALEAQKPINIQLIRALMAEPPDLS
jgi:chromosomal replication initiation ATPase DnaA